MLLCQRPLPRALHCHRASLRGHWRPHRPCILRCSASQEDDKLLQELNISGTKSLRLKLHMEGKEKELLRKDLQLKEAEKELVLRALQAKETQLLATTAELMAVQGKLNIRGLIEFVEQRHLRPWLEKGGKLSRCDLWETAAASEEPNLREMVDCIVKETGWRRDKVGEEISQLYRNLSGAIHDAQLFQESPNAVDLVVPHPLEGKQALALRCIAKSFNIPVRVKGPEPFGTSE